MATPILPTPIIKGKDAERILEELKPIKWIPELTARLERAKAKFKAMSNQLRDSQNQNRSTTSSFSPFLLFL